MTLGELKKIVNGIGMPDNTDVKVCVESDFKRYGDYVNLQVSEYGSSEYGSSEGELRRNFANSPALILAGRWLEDSETHHVITQLRKRKAAGKRSEERK